MHDPSLLWITIPTVLIVSAYYARKWYNARQLRVHGIGKGGSCASLSQWLTLMPLTAPGFQTNVRKVRITPEIAARLQRGENVSPQEIARATAEADEGKQEPYNPLAGRGIVEEVQLGEKQKESAGQVNEWLPESITNPKKRSKGKKR
ncbi:hypothetical protein C0989_005550 [Termitomyces sp. Mn162]|nr:hypothetical protein C0989_005550 [Termitomyces sp. Mn162]